MKSPTSEPGESVSFHRKIFNISLASGSGILTKEDEIECVCKEVRNAARKVGQKSVEEENEGTNFGNQHWSLNDFNIGPVISKGCSAVVYAANCLKNGFETIGNDSEGIKEISRVEKILKDSLDLIPSPPLSVKIQIIGGKVDLRCKG